MTTKRRLVTWSSDEDLQCAILGALGFSTQYIMEQTGLSACQISYRLRKGTIKRADYRNGTSDMAQRVMERVVPSKQGIKQVLNLGAK
jgi:hypothetical protein